MDSGSGKKTNICHDVFADNKTPKMLVNERCVKLKVGVRWDTNLMPVSGAEQQQKFRSFCKISANGSDIPSEISGEGIGASKKDAEQIAAWKVLSHIYSYKELFDMTSAGKIMKTINEKQKQLDAVLKITNNSGEVDEEPVSDTDDDNILGEPIGGLKTLCDRHKIESPFYQEAETKDRSKRSIFKVTCKVGARSTQVGRRYTKKDAKRIAAHRVLVDLGGKGFTMESKKVKSGKSESEEPSGAKRLKKAIQEVTSTVSKTSFCDTEETGASTSASNISCTDHNPSDDDFHDASSQDPDPPRPSFIVLLDEESEVSEKVSVCEPQLPVPDGSSDVVNDKDEDEAMNRPMEIGTGITTGGKKKPKKRKFVLKIGDEYYDSPIVKRKYLEEISRLMMTCQNKIETCLKFVKDISHIVHHSPSTATAKNILVLPEEKLRGGPLKILKELVVELNVTLRFTRAVKLKTSASEPMVRYCVFSKLIFRVGNENVQRCQKIHQFYGRGQSANEAKENASLGALKFIQLLKLASNEQ